VRLVLEAAPDDVQSCFVIQIRQLGVTGVCTRQLNRCYAPVDYARVARARVTLTMQPCAAGGAAMMRSGSYTLGSKDLLTAVQGHCNRRGLRCTDVTGTGQTILIERV